MSLSKKSIANVYTKKACGLIRMKFAICSTAISLSHLWMDKWKIEIYIADNCSNYKTGFI